MPIALGLLLLLFGRPGGDDGPVPGDDSPARGSGCRESEAAMVRAAAAGDRRAIQVALDGGIRPDVTDEAGNSPLACAGPRGHVAVVRLLIDAGADPATTARDGDTVAEDAVRFCQHEVLRLLLDAGAPVGHDPEAGIDLLHPAIEVGDLEATDLLLAEGLDPVWTPGNASSWGPESTSPCPEPTESAQVAVLTRLVDQGADPQIVLAEAASIGAAPIVPPVLAMGADVNGTVASHLPLSIALSGGWLDWLVDLETAGTTTGSSGSESSFDASSVPLIVAAAGQGDAEVVLMLLAAGADADAPAASSGWTALHAAAYGGHRNVIEALLGAGATPSPDGAPAIPSDVARAEGHRGIALLLARAETPR